MWPGVLGAMDRPGLACFAGVRGTPGCTTRRRGGWGRCSRGPCMGSGRSAGLRPLGLPLALVAADLRWTRSLGCARGLRGPSALGCLGAVNLSGVVNSRRNRGFRHIPGARGACWCRGCNCLCGCGPRSGFRPFRRRGILFTNPAGTRGFGQLGGVIRRRRWHRVGRPSKACGSGDPSGTRGALHLRRRGGRPERPHRCTWPVRYRRNQLHRPAWC